MTRFIWVRDGDKVVHYINVNQIVRVTKVPASGSFSEYTYMILRCGKEIRLSNSVYDTADDVISKIGIALV